MVKSVSICWSTNSSDLCATLLAQVSEHSSRVCVLFQDAVALERGGWCCPADEDDLEAPVRSELSCVNADCDQSERYA